MTDGIRELKRRAGILNEQYMELGGLERKITLSKRVKNIKLTANDWGLYGVEDRDEVARMLNNMFSSLVNKGLGRDDVEQGMWNIMREFREYGATDSEPQGVLMDLLNYVFGERR